MYNEITILPEDLKTQIKEILTRVDELNNVDAAIYCGNEIILRACQKKAGNHCEVITKISVIDYSSFIPAY